MRNRPKSVLYGPSHPLLTNANSYSGRCAAFCNSYERFIVSRRRVSRLRCTLAALATTSCQWSLHQKLRFRAGFKRSLRHQNPFALRRTYGARTVCRCGCGRFRASHHLGSDLRFGSKSLVESHRFSFTLTLVMPPVGARLELFEDRKALFGRTSSAKRQRNVPNSGDKGGDCGSKAAKRGPKAAKTPAKRLKTA